MCFLYLLGTKESLQLTGMDYKVQAEEVLNWLVAQSAGQNVKDLERIYTEVCRIIGKHRYEENKNKVLEVSYVTIYFPV